ncbi:hypothetical protein QEO92_27195 (plasmid) [Neorhizobium petrolearium]|uniref:Transposase IS111A/IS1328/IS1533 N-terminal domain-containing protein n=1 Tax=Neorhizobium petrolearium TaxID=515361 RepID=A0ABY8MCG9_9HYPH|nr:hypothetical protein [Neorhizobium petrolearium]WGI72210.1 hypothetical protein QEO92_27195 [Neorhizobium petrolearium]
MSLKRPVVTIGLCAFGCMKPDSPSTRPTHARRVSLPRPSVSWPGARIDRVDAHILARYGVTMDLPAQVRPEPERLELRDLMERRDQLVEMRKSARIRLAQPQPAGSRRACTRSSKPSTGRSR